MRLKAFLLNTIAASPLFSPQQRKSFLQWFNLRTTAWIESGVFFQYPDLSSIEMGDRVFVNHGCYFDNSVTIHIGSNTRIGPCVRILTTTHAKGFPHSASGAIRNPVWIGDDCWIGAGVTILPGVVIGDRVTVGAGAVVTHDLPSGTTCMGVPARAVDQYLKIRLN